MGCIDSDEWALLDDSVKERSKALATNTLRRLTGYRVGGCPITVRPCKLDCSNAWAYNYPWSGFSWFQPWINGAGQWVNACRCKGTCSCTELCDVELPGPVGEVYEVKVDGEVIDEANYRMFGTRLTWINPDEDCPWPTCQNLALDDTEEGTFSVTYLNGFKVDGLGAYAAGVLTWEYAQACTNGQCRFPASVTAITRSGVSYEITPGAFPDGFTGIREVDAYIALWNPQGIQRSTTVWTPDMPRIHH
jgi:hypothetical protein